jgi:hypothetical protein
MSCESATARDKSDHSSLFLSACSTYRRGDAGAFAAPIRQAEGEVRGFIAGYRMTLGVAPSRFAPKMMSGNGRPYGVSQRLLDTSARRCRPFAAPNRQAEGEVYGFIAGYRMTLGAAPSRFAPKMISAEWKALWRFGALARHIGETMQARSPRRIVRRKVKCAASSQDIA